MNKSGMRIGIMGGTFNPIHIGHLVMARNAMEQYMLDQIWFIPNGNPPHKSTACTASLEQRLCMIRLALQDEPDFLLSMEEAGEDRFFYTYETLERLNKEYKNYRFYFIMGADSLFEIETWKNFRRIFPLCTILAAVRDDKHLADMKQRITQLESKYGASISLLHSPVLEISSTDLRFRIMNKKSVRYLLPEPVENYIAVNQIYSDKTGEMDG